MAIKELQTRIALKYDSYSAWTTAPGKDLVLLKGEIGICEIPSANAASNVAPTVLFKVGDGSKTFEALPWASAKAADVYSWAKASDVQLEGKTLKFIGTDKTVTLDYITETEVKAITDPLAAKITAIESKFSGDASVEGRLDSVEGRLDVIEGEGEGSVKKALADAKAYTDTRETVIKQYADQAEADAVSSAKSYTDTEVGKNTERIVALESADAAQDALIDNNAKAIAQEVTDRTNAITSVTTAYEAADKAINDKIGGEYSSTSTVHDAIVDAKKAGTDAAAAVDTLAKGQVATNAADITNLRSDLDSCVEKDGELEGRLESIEAFFEAADHDGEDGGLTDALDTLKEIQDYLNNEGSATDGLIGRIAAAESEIDNLQNEFVDGGRVAKAEADITDLAADITALNSVTKGYTGEGAIKAAVDKAQSDATQGITDAQTAQEAVNTLAAKVNDSVTGLAATKEIADSNTASIAGLAQRVGTNETDIVALKEIVISGANSNDKLKAAIDALNTLTGDEDKGNEALYTEIDRVAALVDNQTSGLAATKKIADDADALSKANAGRLTAIEADYLKAADAYIFNCGTASSVVHVKQ